MQSTNAICPSLFNATITQDGILSRIHLPAGLITSTQCQLITQVVNQFGNGEVQITNRANLQIRTNLALSKEILLDLQDYGLASSCANTDGLRNIMTSPTAGIDSQAKINTISLAKQWNLYLLNHPELEILSNKFSVCFDGGEVISVRNRPNDICFVAVEVDGEIHLSLHLGLGDRGESPLPVNVLIPDCQVMEVLATLTEVYRDYTEERLNQSFANKLRSRPPRLREMLSDYGVQKFLDLVESKLQYSLRSMSLEPLNQEQATKNYAHLGVHAQKQSGLFYIGVVVPLGRLTSHQLEQLANLAKQYGGGALRLTPWQNLLITDITEADVAEVTQEILELGLSISANHPYAAIAACSGSNGCKSAHTNTQSDARAIASHLEKCMQLDYPINLHFSGCDKSCAQHHPSDIAIVGKDFATYTIYLGDGEIDFGRELYGDYRADDLPMLVEQLLTIYQNQRQPKQSFREFVNHCDLQELANKLREVIRHA